MYTEVEMESQEVRGMESQEVRNNELRRLWSQVQGAHRRVQAQLEQDSGGAPDAVPSFTVVLGGAGACGVLPPEFVARVLQARGER